MTHSFNSSLFHVLLVGLLLPSLAFPHQEPVDERIPIANVEELPSSQYSLGLPLAELLESEAHLRNLAKAVTRDLDQVFETYEILDPALRRKLYQAAFHAALIDEQWDRAELLLTRARALEEREDLQQIAALHWEAWILTKREMGEDEDLEALRPVYAKHLRTLAEAQPWSLIHGELERRAARSGLIGRGLLDRAMASVLGEAVDGRSIEASTAREFLPMVNGVRVLLPLKNEMGSVYSAYLTANAEEQVDTFSLQQVTLESDANCQTVRLAVWDTGVDTHIFRDQLWRNPQEVADGVDNDGNGYVDDLHGIAFDPGLSPSPELLYPPDPDETVWKRARSYSRGLSDVSASIDSPQARRLQRKLSRFDQEEVLPFLNELMHYAVHSHGTHVAGIALEGNPFAELLVARIGLGHHQPGERMSLAWAHRFAAMCHDSVDYFVANDVRVVNMSWGWGVAEIEENLRDTGSPGSDAERLELARAIHGILARGIEDSLASAEGILFVCGAGNSGEDSSRDRFVPGCLDLPNLVTVGGVDRSGNMTAFTSFGDHVRLYANGYQVESFVPGGERAPQSGTSMSSPQVANLAAKLLAVSPDLGPRELIEIMLRGAETKDFAGSEVHILNPKGTFGLL